MYFAPRGADGGRVFGVVERGFGVVDSTEVDERGDHERDALGRERSAREPTAGFFERAERRVVIADGAQHLRAAEQCLLRVAATGRVRGDARVEVGGAAVVAAAPVRVRDHRERIDRFGTVGAAIEHGLRDALRGGRVVLHERAGAVERGAVLGPDVVGRA